MKTLCSLVMTVAALLSPLSSGATATNAPAYDTTISQAETLEIAEAVFRFQFAHNSSGLKQKAPSYFLSLFGNDPDADFLARFKGNTPPVKKGTEFKSGEGLKFQVAKIKRITDSKVAVEGGYYETELSSSANTYTVEKQDDKWTVTSDRMHWIS